MNKDSRVRKSLLNARINTICYFASLVVAFFTRKILLDKLGADFIGLTSTLQSLLGFLNLAELGVGTAIGYVLYKPIFDEDHIKINEIISVFGYLYRCIGLLIFLAGLLLSCFLPWIFSNIDFPIITIYWGFYTYLATSLLGYFMNYRMTLLSADQKNYVVTGYFQASTTAKVIVQMILAILIQSYYIYFIIELVFGIINSSILNWKINHTYPWLKSDVRLGHKLFSKYPDIGKYVKQLFIHKIASFVQWQVTPFLIYSFVSLPIVALYGNYTLITQRIQGLITGVMDSTGAGVGNLISEGDKERIYRTYSELFSIRFLVGAVLASCFYYLGTPFVNIWLGNLYVLSDILVFLLSTQLFFAIVRGTTDQFIFGYGLFYDVWAPILESVIFILSSIIFGHIYGLAGVLMGPLISTSIIVYCWKPYFLYSKGFHMSIWKYLMLFSQHLFPCIIAYFISVYFCYQIIGHIDISLNWTNWLVGACVFTSVMGVVCTALMYICSKHLRYFIFRFIKK